MRGTLRTVGVSEIEFLGSAEDDQPDEPGEPTGSRPGRGSAPRRPRWSHWFRTPGGPIAAVLTAVLVAFVAAGFAVARQSTPGDDFDLTLISAQYTVPQDASGIDLALVLQNTGSSMIELTGVGVYQPGLIRQTQTGDAAGVTENEAGASTASALGPGTAIASTALTPKDVEIVTVPFHFDCGLSSFPPVNRAVSVAGFSALGTARTTRITLPPEATPWLGVLRSATCGLPAVQSDLTITYGGIGDALATLSPLRFNYGIVLTAAPDAPVTVNSISPDNPGIAASIDPAMPVRVLNGQPVRLRVSWRVMSCVIATSVHSADGVKVTASAGQAVQSWDVKLGAQFTKDLDAEISTVCSGG